MTKRRLWPAVLLASLLSGCGGGSGGGGTAVDGDGDGGDTPTPHRTGQAMLGPLVAATVKLYDFEDPSSLFYETETTDSTSLTTAGTFDVPESLLTDDALYMVTVSGGSDIDADDDGVVDSLPIANEGTLHLLAGGSDLKSGDFKINVLSELVYRNLYHQISAGYSKTEISQALDILAQRLIRDDVNGDGMVNNIDLLQWNPITDRDKLLQAWSTYADVITRIHDDENVYDLSAQLIRPIKGSVSGTAYATTVSGDYAYVSNGGSGLQVVDISDRFTRSRGQRLHRRRGV